MMTMRTLKFVGLGSLIFPLLLVLTGALPLSGQSSSLSASLASTGQNRCSQVDPEKFKNLGVFSQAVKIDAPTISVWAEPVANCQRAQLAVILQDPAGLRELMIADEMHQVSYVLDLKDGDQHYPTRYEDQFDLPTLFLSDFKLGCDPGRLGVSVFAVNAKGAWNRGSVALELKAVPKP